MLSQNEFSLIWEEILLQPLGKEAIRPGSTCTRLVEEFASRFNGQCVGFECRDGYPSFLLEIEDIQIKGMDKGLNVVVFAAPPRDESERNRIDQFLYNYAKQTKILNSLCFVIFQATAPFGCFTPQYLDNTIGLFGQDLENILFSRMPQEHIIRLIRTQQPNKQLCPFDTTRTATGSMFVGRHAELHQLTDSNNQSLLLSGSRRIGKSSICEKAVQDLQAMAGTREKSILINCITCRTYHNVLLKIAEKLNVTYEEITITGLHRFLRNYTIKYSKTRRAMLAFFFDEFDEVAKYERSNDWELLKQLYESSEQKHIRVVFVGYREVNYIQSDTNSPFFRRCKQITLPPLSEKEVGRLFLAPLKPFGVTILEEKDFLRFLVKQSGGLPYLLHFFGEQLWDTYIARGETSIGTGELKQICQSHATNSYLMENFYDNTKPLERVIALILAHHSSGDKGMTVGDLNSHCLDLHLSVNGPEVSRACENLVSANIFAFEGEYRFLFPLYQDTLKRNYSWDNVLTECRAYQKAKV